jgi:predicted RNase H-like HicB family nuclease
MGTGALKVEWSEEDEGFVASFDDIGAAGVGKTEAEAVRHLASLLADFVRGRDETIASSKTGFRA